MWINFNVNGPQLHLAQTYNEGALPLRVHQSEAFKHRPVPIKQKVDY
jgi:hypothetical protein